MDPTSLLSLHDIFLQYVNFAWHTFNFDMWVFSQWWCWAPLGIPAVCYGVFFMIKWVFITFPLWFPVSAVFGVLTAPFKKLPATQEKESTEVK